jgi:hypothetical protein
MEGNTPDREFILQRQQVQQAEQNTVAQMDHYDALGVGMATFCVAMYTTLRDEGTFTPAQALALVQAAVHSR